MKRVNLRKTLTAVGMVAAVLVAALAIAGPPYGLLAMGTGMMGGSGMGQGMGSGMMGGGNRMGPAPTPAAPPGVGNGDPIQAGRQVYTQTCIVCHGADGRGAIRGTPDFTRRDGPLAKSDDTLLQHAERGFQTPGSPMAMPPKGGNARLSEQDLKNAIAYMRREFRR